MADRYWVWGSGNWNDTGHWSASSWGASGASAPWSSDNVIFDSASHNANYSVTINVVANCLSFTASAPSSGNLTLHFTTNVLNIFANMTLYNGILFTWWFSVYPSIEFESTSTGRTITTNWATIRAPLVFNWNWGWWTLQDDLILGNDGAWNLVNITHTRGTLNTNWYTVTCRQLISSNSNVRALTLWASVLNVSDFSPTTVTNLTFTAWTSTFNFDTGIWWVGLTFYNANKVWTRAWFLIRWGTFNDLNISTWAGLTYACEIRADITVSWTLTLASDSAASRLLVRGLNWVPAQKTITAAAVTTSNVNFKDIIGAGAASRDLSAENSGDCGNNTDITFTTADNLYWVWNWGNRSDTSHWSTSSGWSGGARIPLPQDTAFIDANSITSASQTIVNDMFHMGNIDFTGVLNTPTFSNGDTIMYGSLTYVSGMTLADNAEYIIFSWAGAMTFDSAWLITNQDIAIENTNGSLTFMSDMLSWPNAVIWQESWTLDFNDFDVSCGYFYSYDATLLKWGDWTLTIKSTYPLDMDYAYDNTIFLPEWSTLKLEAYDVSEDPIDLYTSELIYNNIRVATWWATITFNESTTFGNFHADAGVDMEYGVGVIITASSITVWAWWGGGWGWEHSYWFIS